MGNDPGCLVSAESLEVFDRLVVPVGEGQGISYRGPLPNIRGNVPRPGYQ